MEGIQVSTQVAGSRGQIAIIKVGGYIDTTTSSEVERALNSLLKQGRYQIIIDLGNVDYISSAGWGIFISEIKAIRENNGDLKLVRMIPDVYEIFELLEFHHILDVYDSIEEAIHKFEESQYVEMVSDTGQQTSRQQSFSASSHSSGGEAISSSGPKPDVQRPTGTDNSAPAQQQAKKPSVLDLINMPVEEKIKYVVAKEPEIGAYKINKRLNSPDFGYTKVGWFGVRSWLNKLGLSSRKSRRQFSNDYKKMYE